MHFFPLSSVLIVLSNLIVAIILLLKVNYKKLNVIWGYFCLSVVIWGLGSFGATITTSKEASFFWWQIANIGSVLTPIIFYQFVAAFVNKNSKVFLNLLYSVGIFLLLVNFFKRDIFIGDIRFMFDQFYYIDWTIRKSLMYFLFYIGFYWILLLYSFYLVINKFSSSTGIERNQLKYLLFAMVIGWLGPHMIWLPAFGISMLYPYANILMGIYPVIIGYAIVRYRLLDIRLAITKAGIFLSVYSLVLGLPFYFAYIHGAWQLSLWIMLVLATLGPSIYLFLNRKAEAVFLEEERRISNLLMQAGYGMASIHEIEKLFQLIREVLVTTVQPKSVAIFLFNEEARQYELRESTDRAPGSVVINDDDVLVKELRTTRRILVDEGLGHESGGRKVRNLSDRMTHMSAAVLVPIMMDNSLLGFVALGQREVKTVYSDELLNALTVLGRQMALSLKLCHYWAQKVQQIEEEGSLARQESTDMLVGTLAHEIDNPLTYVISEAEFGFEILDSPRYQILDEPKKILKKSLSAIAEGARRVSDIVKILEDYGKKEQGKFEAVYINDLVMPINAIILMYRKKYRGVQFVEEIDSELPPIWGQKILIEEIIVNLTRNALHAVHRHQGYEGRVVLKVYLEAESIVLETVDNGYGIEPKILKQLFKVPTTTKGSAEGRGLGLYHVRRIVVEVLKGEVFAESEGQGKGARFVVKLPVYKGEDVVPKGMSRRVF